MAKKVIAALQVGSSPDGTEATLRNILSYEAEIIRSGASLVVIPEATLGGYPKGSNFDTYLGYRLQSGKEEFRRYFQQAIEVGSGDTYPEVAQLCKLSKNTGASIVCGCIERDRTTLYCSMLYIDPIQGLVGKHRKLMPTASERLVWGQGDGSTLPVVDSAVGKLGGAICWENMMPLMRYAMYAKGVEVWCAPTVDQRPIWRTIMQNIGYEGRLFVVSAVQFMPNATVMGLGEVIDEQGTRRLPGAPGDGQENLINGGSVIVDPYGEIIAGPLLGKEGLVTAEIDTNLIIESRFDFDPTGHYSRGDVFQLTVNEKSRETVFE
ncbi:LADA_0E06150g1_1 [Lachancea dasiensis]|uniref:LADA_0E06150g1_1 n=1 Tax=Lachancea dasiensis TaxID=1072105 RepID=A0A1G4JCB9_9SACH|nr:LADA_0E06150g1_1 [Lachancea dasiensis]